MSGVFDNPELGAAIAAAFSELKNAIRSQRGERAEAERRPVASPLEDAAMTRSLAQARRRAAVLGWFDPQRLVEKAEGRQQERVLSGLVVDCDVELFGPRPLWRLRREPRRALLTALTSDDRLLARTLRETAALATNDEARLLRRVLRGKPVMLRRVGIKECSPLLQVTEWTSGILPNAPDPFQVRALLARNSILESLGLLIQNFRGRKTELKIFRRFVFRRADSEGQLPILALSGIGGAGKSTLLARFAHGLLGRASKAAVVILDFDRARLAGGDPVALTFELTRQIGAWFPEIAAPLRQLRHDARTNLLSSGFADQRHLETLALEASARSTKELSYLLPDILRQAEVGTPGGLPLLIILDTFEILQGGRGEAAEGGSYRGVEAVAEWAQDLFSMGGLSRLRLVVAGRAPIGEDPSFGPRLTEPEIRLTGLDEACSVTLLRDLGLDAEQARAVVEAVGDPHNGSCNPLILRLVARLAQAGSLDPRVLAGAESHGSLDQELVQGILYRRILAHIGDQEKDTVLAALAHPGLVLRRVTPDLIEHVLFPVLEVAERGPARARELFERLRREVWLVRQIDANTVEHRADLRRTMLRLIDADMRQQARKIHLAASAYYAAHASGPNEPLAAGEAFYHRLMVMDAAQAGLLDPAEIVRFESALQASLDDLPPHVLAVVKSVLDRPLSDEEGQHLPEPRRTEFILRQGERHLLNDHPDRALRLLEAQPNLHPLWELRALSLTARWAEAKERGLLSPFFQESGEAPERLNLAAWSLFCLGESTEAFELLSQFFDEIPMPMRPAIPLLEEVARSLSYWIITAEDAGKTGLKPPKLNWRDLNEETLSTTAIALEATRQAALLWRGFKEHGPPVIFSGEALPPSVRLLKQLAAADLPAEPRVKLLALKTRLEALPKSASSGHILGTIARGFPKALILRPPFRTHGRLLSSLVFPNPELRGPVKFALLEAFRTEQELTRLAELAYDLLDLRPKDFQPDVFARTAVRPGRAGSEIANLVHYLDRSAALGPFLQAVHQEKPGAATLERVANVFERWEKSFRIE